MRESRTARHVVPQLFWEEPEQVAEAERAGIEDVYLSTGTVSVLMGDLEGSTRLWEADPAATAAHIERFQRAVSQCVGRAGGVLPLSQGEGDGFLAAFARVSDALAAALALQLELRETPLRVRAAVHAGEVQRRSGGDYMGRTVNRCARLRDVAHGGQVIFSNAARQLLGNDLPDGAWLEPLGEHRLPDLSESIEVHMLRHRDLASGFPPLKSLDATPHNLPVERTTFVGREAELAELEELLRGTRMLTLTGTGGAGKTRLALQLAARVLADHPHGAWFCDLSGLTEGVQVMAAVAAVWKLRADAGLPLDDYLAAHLGTRDLVLVLDNCEQVLQQAAELGDLLLDSCPNLRLVATSRQPLGLAGEVTWRVPSLPLPPREELPSIEALRESEAVQLFAERAARSRPGFAVSDANGTAVAEICRRLDGIPLAIELAAARIRVFTPAQIAAELGERFRLLTGGVRTAMPRQQTLRASVDWSYELLTAPERTLLRRLGMFAGGFTLAAAERVGADDELEAHQVLDQLTLLVDKSLVQVDVSGDESRYQLLETIREYALGRLRESGEEREVRDRHLDLQLDLVVAGPRTRLDGGDVLAALEWAGTARRAEPRLRLASALQERQLVPPDAARARLESALSETPDADPAERSRALRAMALAGILLGDFDQADKRLEEALELAKGAGALAVEALALSNLSALAHIRGDAALAVELGGDALDKARASGDLEAECEALLQVAANKWLAEEDMEGACREAAAAAEAAGNDEVLRLVRYLRANNQLVYGNVDTGRSELEAIDLGPHPLTAAVLLAVGDRDALEANMAAWKTQAEGSRVAWVAGSVALLEGLLAWLEGDLPTARDAFLKSGRLFQPWTNWFGFVTMCLVEVEVRLGLVADARLHADEFAARVPANSTVLIEGPSLLITARVLRAEGRRSEAEAAALEGVGKLERVTHGVLGLELLAALAADAESWAESARLLGAAAADRHRTGFRGQPDAADDVTRVRAALGDVVWERFFAEGRQLDVRAAIDYARRGRGERRRPSAGWASLTPMEVAVARQVAGGLTNKAIGTELFISPATVRTHLAHAFAKLGVSGRAELAALAAKHGG